ncbi:DCC-interacting protein 13-beta [Larimichthys crocea]|uniref:Uncharacterized protein n=1 Tax=Larimichthys crocea TaxID=215358 RepID=A0ACD3QF12_LARCR|nr:DCC-interacting protein 13-beta [Larimichthys crocea]
MPAVHHKLLLEEALQDSPQTRSLLSVFEEDAGMLTTYTNQLLQSLQRVFGAQSEMGLATEQLSKQLLEYEKKDIAPAHPLSALVKMTSMERPEHYPPRKARH